MKGLFIVIEGIDGSGKTHLAKQLQERLTGLGEKVLLVRQPGGTPVAESIRDVLLTKHVEEMSIPVETLLYLAARVQLIDNVVRPALNAGSIVIADRHEWSTIAYQGIPFPDVHDYAHQLKPDFIFHMDCPPKKAIDRMEARSELDRLEERTRGILNSLYDTYQALERDAEPNTVIHVDASSFTRLNASFYKPGTELDNILTSLNCLPSDNTLVTIEDLKEELEEHAGIILKTDMPHNVQVPSFLANFKDSQYNSATLTDRRLHRILATAGIEYTCEWHNA